MSTPQTPESTPSNEQRLARYLTMIRRALRHWLLAAIVGCLTVVLSIVVAVLMPRHYRSECLIYYREELRRDYFSDREGDGQRDLAHRLNQILWSRTRLMKIIKRLDLYPKLRALKTEEEVVETMRDAISVREKGGDTFWVSYEGRDPATVQKVTQLLADTFVAESTREAVERSRATSEFIGQEALKAKRDLDRATSELAQFYEQHPELVPDGIVDPRAPGATMRVIGKAAAHRRRPRYVIKGASPELRALLTEKGRLEGQIALARTALRTRGPSDRERELADARRELMLLRARFSDDYPDVIRAHTRLRRLERLNQQTRRGDQDIATMQDEVARLDVEIARLTPKAKRSGSTRTPEAKRPLAANDPATIETDYNRLVQQYEVAKARNAVLADKQLQARAMSNLETTQQRATFRIVDPAYFPGRPSRPRRRKIALLGAFFGLLLGAGAAGARVLFDPRVYDESDLISLGSLPLLAQIPPTDDRAER